VVAITMDRLTTRRLELIPASVETLELLVAYEFGEASELLGVEILPGWPYEPEAIEEIPWHLKALQTDPSALLWRVRLIVLRAENRVIGSTNFKGRPASDGTVEIGWRVTPEYRGQGIATEATQAMIAWAMGHSKVKRVVATIRRDNDSSEYLAKRIGMTLSRETRRDLRVWELRRTNS
jgi:[ribosomal protein S5]-alanine N-acetyltransferase